MHEHEGGKVKKGRKGEEFRKKWNGYAGKEEEQDWRKRRGGRKTWKREREGVEASEGRKGR